MYTHSDSTPARGGIQPGRAAGGLPSLPAAVRVVDGTPAGPALAGAGVATARLGVAGGASADQCGGRGCPPSPPALPGVGEGARVPQRSAPVATAPAFLGSTQDSCRLALRAGSDRSNLEALSLRHVGEHFGLLERERLLSRMQVAWGRLERWALQSAAAAALAWAHDTPRAGRVAKLADRLAKCCRVPLGSSVNVDHNPKTGAASYSNLVTCGSVWCCPVCAAKVSERRRHELKAGIDAATARGARVWLLTLTFPHTKADDLGELLARFDKARKALWGGAAANDDRDAWGLAGHVTALEVTRTWNGWHPHAHILLVFRPGSTVTLDAVRDRLKVRWEKVCARVGLIDPDDAGELENFRKHGLVLENGTRAASYVSKFGLENKGGAWDLAAEVTKAHLKRGRKAHSRTPWDLLRSYLEDGDLEDAGLFVEYADAFKGKRQLRFSPGLRAFLGLNAPEKTDEELAQERGEGAHLLAVVPLAAWRLVVRAGARGSLLAAASSGNPADVWGYLDALRARHAPHLPPFRPPEVLDDAG